MSTATLPDVPKIVPRAPSLRPKPTLTVVPTSQSLTGTCVRCGFDFQFKRTTGSRRRYCDDCRDYVKHHRAERCAYSKHRKGDLFHDDRSTIRLENPNVRLAAEVVRYRLAFQMISFLAYRGMKKDLAEIYDIIKSVEAPAR